MHVRHLSIILLITVVLGLLSKWPVELVLCRTETNISIPAVRQVVPPIINLAVVACGDYTREALTMIKSALMFSRNHFHLLVFADAKDHSMMRDQLGRFPPDIRLKFAFTLHDIMLPSTPDWRICFKPCASQRLFFPDVLRDIDRLIYVDTDIMFLGPIDELWGEFDKFNSVQIAGVAWHDEEHHIKLYAGDMGFPYYLPNGLNSGVMLMDLPRMRAANWTGLVLKYYLEYKDALNYCDQDIVNIIFHDASELLFKLDCKYNYRINYCRWPSQTCLTAASDGVSGLHGNPSIFRRTVNGSLGFKAIHNFIVRYEFDRPYKEQLSPLMDLLYNMTSKHEMCRHHLDTLTKRLVQATNESLYNALADATH